MLIQCVKNVLHLVVSEIFTVASQVVFVCLNCCSLRNALMLFLLRFYLSPLSFITTSLPFYLSLSSMLSFYFYLSFSHNSSIAPSLFSSLCPPHSSKYRPSSEHHNDNFSLSTIAEGSHPNVRKLCDTPPNVPHARALAYYDNIICQVTCFSSLSYPPSPPLCMDPKRNLSSKGGGAQRTGSVFSAEKVCSQIGARLLRQQLLL